MLALGTHLPDTAEGLPLARRHDLFYPKADATVSRDHVQVSTAEVLEAMVASGIDASDVHPLGVDGTLHSLFLVSTSKGEWVAKFRTAPSDSVGVDVERAVSEALWGARKPHARVLISDSSCLVAKVPFMVMERVHGQSLREIDEVDAAVAPTLRAQGAALRDVHEVRAAGYGLIQARQGSTLVGLHDSWQGYISLRLDEHLEVLRQAGILTAEVSTAVRVTLDSVPECVDPRLLHGDCGPHNVFLGPEGVVLIDWEDALAGDPMFDVALWCTFAPERRWAEFLSGYVGTAWDPDERFWKLFLRIAVAKSVVRHRLGIEDRPGRPRAAARIDRALGELRVEH